MTKQILTFMAADRLQLVWDFFCLRSGSLGGGQQTGSGCTEVRLMLTHRPRSGVSQYMAAHTTRPRQLPYASGSSIKVAGDTIAAGPMPTFVQPIKPIGCHPATGHLVTFKPRWDRRLQLKYCCLPVGCIWPPLNYYCDTAEPRRNPREREGRHPVINFPGE